MAENHCWSLDSLRNVNGRITRYFDVQERGAVVGGQGECRKGKAEFKADAGNQVAVESVAIKRLSYAFSCAHDAKYAYRELVLLSLVRHPNLIHLLDVLVPTSIDFPLSAAADGTFGQNVAELTELVLVTRHGGETLSSKMRQRNLLKQRWPLAQIASILFQLLSGIDYLHQAGIVHRDLKINNIVLNERGQLKILDFGCGRYINAGSKMTPGMMVPFYRPPEIFLGINSYDTKVDMWSVGCIFAELMLGRRLFNGTDFERQWPKFVDILGSPDLEGCFGGWMDQIRPSYLEFARKLDKIEPKGWQNLLPNQLFSASSANDLAIENARDLVAKMLQFDPSSRISAAQAMLHPFFEGIQQVVEYEKEEKAEDCRRHYDFGQENDIKSVAKWKEMILQKIDQFAKESMKAGE